MLVLASKSYPPLMHSQLNVMNAANITSQASGQYSESYSGMKAGRTLKEVKMLLEMLKRYNKTKSISEAADICKYLTDLYQVELEAINEEPA